MMLDISEKQYKNKHPDVRYSRNYPSIRNLKHKLNQSANESKKVSYQGPFYLGHNLSSSGLRKSIPAITVHVIDNEDNAEAKVA